jgi:DNA polymerase IV
MNHIVHFDGDSFFASVEVALNHKLRGLPVVTGGERGAATSVNYIAKKFGIVRSMTMRQIKQMCPNVVVVNSSYRDYAIFAHRMYRLARRIASVVEEYSVDECFADIGGLDVVYGKPYPEVAQDIKSTLETSLGITFGVGLAPTKVLAKVASKHRKPAGFTHITMDNRREFLEHLPIGSVWGIGSASIVLFNELGVHTALQFADKTLEWLKANHIAKPHRAIWYELNGRSVYPVHGEPSDDVVGSIIKSRTFSPPSTEKAFLYSQLSKNVEKACEKARLYSVRPRAITFFLKTQSFLYGRVELTLPVATADPRDIMRVIKPQFEKLYRKGVLYRATGISLRAIVPESSFTHDLFGEAPKTNENLSVLNSIDKLNSRYGAQTVFLGASMQAITYKGRGGGKGAKKTFDLPFLGKTS